MVSIFSKINELGLRLELYKGYYTCSNSSVCVCVVWWWLGGGAQGFCRCVRLHTRGVLAPNFLLAVLSEEACLTVRFSAELDDLDLKAECDLVPSGQKSSVWVWTGFFCHFRSVKVKTVMLSWGVSATLRDLLYSKYQRSAVHECTMVAFERAQSDPVKWRRNFNNQHLLSTLPHLLFLKIMKTTCFDHIRTRTL